MKSSQLFPRKDYKRNMDYSNLEAGIPPTYIRQSKFNNIRIRMEFIRKTYSILCEQLLYTFGLVLLATFNDGFKYLMQSNLWFTWICIIFEFVLIFSLIFMWNIQKIYPYNYIFLAIFTLPFGYTTAFVTTIYDPSIVLSAIGTTLIIVAGLTLFACQTKVDFTEFYGILFIGLTSLTTTSIVMLFVCGQNECETLDMIQIVSGIFIFIGYIVVDTQMMIGGGHSRQFEPDEHVIAAMNLYLDVINLFLKLLKLLSKFSKKGKSD